MIISVCSDGARAESCFNLFISYFCIYICMCVREMYAATYLRVNCCVKNFHFSAVLSLSVSDNRFFCCLFRAM